MNWYRKGDKCHNVLFEKKAGFYLNNTEFWRLLKWTMQENRLDKKKAEVVSVSACKIIIVLPWTHPRQTSRTDTDAIPAWGAYNSVQSQIDIFIWTTSRLVSLTVEGEKAFMAKPLVKFVIISDSQIFVADINSNVVYETVLAGWRGQRDSIKIWIGIIAAIAGVYRYGRMYAMDLCVVVLMSWIASYKRAK